MNRKTLVLCSLLLLPLMLGACKPKPLSWTELSNVHIVDMHAPEREAVVVIADDQRGLLWYHATANQNLDAMINPPEPSLERIEQLSVSDDDRWLAVISVGEGHPVVDVFDLRAVLTTPQNAEPQPLKAIAAINPYPGRVSIDSWKDGVLRLRSDVNLDQIRQNSGDDAINPKESIYLWSIEDDTITKQP
jgi:hypothetical protein